MKSQLGFGNLGEADAKPQYIVLEFMYHVSRRIRPPPDPQTQLVCTI